MKSSNVFFALVNVLVRGFYAVRTFVYVAAILVSLLLFGTAAARLLTTYAASGDAWTVVMLVFSIYAVMTLTAALIEDPAKPSQDEAVREER